MSFTVSDIPNPSDKRYLFEENDTLQKTAGSEISSPAQFFNDTVTEVWFSIANYDEPHLTDTEITGSTFVVKVPIESADRYKEIMQKDLGITFTEVRSTETKAVLLSTQVAELSDFQRYQLASYPDVRDCSLSDLTDPSMSYNQNQQEMDFWSTYGSGMSHRVYMYIHTHLDEILQTDDPVGGIKQYLTGQNTENRAEQVVEVLDEELPESVLYELGALKPKQAFKQVVDKLYAEAVSEISVPIEYENVYTNVEYVKIEI